MRNRRKLFQMWLSDDEYQKLKNDSEKCGKSMSAYIRVFISDKKPVAIPPMDYHKMISEIRKVGYNIRQIAQKAYSLNFVDAPAYERNAKSILDLCDNLTMVCVPRRKE